MKTERPTVRPVTLGRLVELTHLCEIKPRQTKGVEDHLDITRKRARETILEALRLALITEVEQKNESSWYESTDIGDEFLTAIRAEEWPKVSNVLARQSPHYAAFLTTVTEIGPAALDEILDRLAEIAQDSLFTYNQTSVEVVGDWGERLGSVQRNAFTGEYYSVDTASVPPTFPNELLDAIGDLEESAGLNLRQRYLAIPELREYVCEHLSCTRPAFDEALNRLVRQNIGKVELLGAPIDTRAKDAQLGIKEISLSTEKRLVSTSQSTEQVMQGIEQDSKQYYYVAVYDQDLNFTQETKI